MSQTNKPRTFADIVAEVDAMLARAEWAKDNSPPINKAGDEIEPEVDHSEGVDE